MSPPEQRGTAPPERRPISARPAALEPSSGLGRPLLTLLFIALLAFNFPVLAIIETVRESGRAYFTSVYLFAAWALIVLVAAVLIERRRGR
jgi:hypothetical protein